MRAENSGILKNMRSGNFRKRRNNVLIGFNLKRLLVKVVVKLVVAGKGQEHAKARSKREVYLRGSVHPHLNTNKKQQQ